MTRKMAALKLSPLEAIIKISTGMKRFEISYFDRTLRRIYRLVYIHTTTIRDFLISSKNDCSFKGNLPGQNHDSCYEFRVLIFVLLCQRFGVFFLIII